MKLNYVGVVALSAASAFAPSFLLAQTGTSSQPGYQQPQQTQSQQTQQPGGTQGTGMAGAMTAGAGGNNEMQAAKDKMFLRKAAQGGMAEIQLGQLASQKGGSDDVKSFGQKMVTDHTTLNDDMKPIAESMGVMLPKKISKEDQAEYDKLNGLSGDDFDKEYLAYMVKDHHKDLREFRAEDATVQDATLKAAVEKGQKVVREHSMMVDKLAQAKGLPVPQRGGGATPPMAQ